MRATDIIDKYRLCLLDKKIALEECLCLLYEVYNLGGMHRSGFFINRERLMMRIMEVQKEIENENEKKGVSYDHK